MCFECNEANDRDCYNKQVKIECKGYEDSCFTAFVKVPTSENKIESTEQSLWKGCTERKTCNEQCSWYNERGHSCQVSKATTAINLMIFTILQIIRY